MIPVVVLNLERESERKNNMIEQFVHAQIKDYYFLPAYDGRYMTNLTLNANIGLGYGMGRQFQKGELGIIMSQIGALKFAQMMGWEEVIVLEDDVVLCEDWLERLTILKSNLPENWEHVYLSAHSDYVKFKVHQYPTLIKSPQAVGAFSYMVNKTAYSKLIKFATSFITTFDDMVMHMVSQGKLNSYMYFPFMTYHNANNSTVWSEKPGHIAHENSMHSSYKFYKNKL
jgi:GR25 family glycosyltransferase involved in LPS biosynthesis